MSFEASKIEAFTEGPGSIQLIIVCILLPQRFPCVGMQGITPLHVAVFPKTHIKDLADWSWVGFFQEDLRQYYFDNNCYSAASRRLSAASKVLAKWHLQICDMCKLFPNHLLVVCTLAERVFHLKRS